MSNPKPFPYYCQLLGALHAATVGAPCNQLVAKLAKSSGFSKELLEAFAGTKEAAALYNKYPPPTTNIHVTEDPNARLDAEELELLVKLAKVAMREPWTVAEGDDKWDGWPVASFGHDYQLGDDGKVDDERPMLEISVTTDHVHCSDRLYTARDEAEWCVAARKLIPKLGVALVRDAKPAPVKIYKIQRPLAGDLPGDCLVYSESKDDDFFVPLSDPEVARYLGDELKVYVEGQVLDAEDPAGSFQIRKLVLDEQDW